MNTAKKAALVLAATGMALGAAAGSAFATSGAQADGAATLSPASARATSLRSPCTSP